MPLPLLLGCELVSAFWPLLLLLVAGCGPLLLSPGVT
jgi:hypothetical protein